MVESMGSLVSVAVNLLGFSSVLGPSCFYLYHQYYPKNLGEWLSYYEMERISDDDSKKFKAVFFEHKDSVGDLQVEGLSNSSAEDDAAQKIKEGCEKSHLETSGDKNKYDNLVKFCVFDPKIAGALLIGKGKSMITDDEDYKVVFSIFKHDNNSINKISEISNTDKVDDALPKLKAWCSTKYKEKIDKTYFEPLSIWCTPYGKKVKTVEDKLKNDDKNGKQQDEANWNDHFEKGKHTQSITQEINKGNSGDSISSSTDKTVGGPKMKTGCENSLKKKLYEDNVYKDLYEKVKSACKKGS